MRPMNKLLTGIYVVEYRWELILLRRGLEEDMKTVRPEDFKVLLLQSFDIDYITKILDNLYSNTKLLIDFDRCKVKVIKPKDIPYENSLLYYFNSDNLQKEIDNGIDDYDMYDKNGGTI